MQVGDSIQWEDGQFTVVGVDPMSLRDRCAYLEDENGVRVAVPIEELETPLVPPAPGFAGFRSMSGGFRRR